jgi:hypothetical protein
MFLYILALFSAVVKGADEHRDIV